MIKLKASNGAELAADAYGDNKNQAIVFLHGGGQTRHAWGSAARVLAQEGFYTMSVDMRGHGDSDWVDDGDYSLNAFANDVGEIAGTFSTPPILVGASLGGLSSLLFAGRAARKDSSPQLNAVVLVDVVPKINMEGAGNIQAFMTANPDGFATLDEAADAIAKYIPHRKRPKNLDGLNKNLRQRENGRYYWHWDPRLMQGIGNTHTEQELAQAGKAVKIPTLLVHGSRSDIIDEVGLAHFREQMPNAEYVKVEGAGHMIAGDSNAAFNGVVLDFLKRFKH